MKTITLLFALFLLVGCASYKAIMPTQVDADKGAATYTGYTLAELNQGKTLYEAKCGNCHGLKKPSSKTQEQWQQIVPRMAVKANKRGEVINAHDQELILKFLVTMGGK
ncbi:hypothetical protein BH09BAC1_BH09BAC1_22540 [soil metagenome]